MFAYLRCLAHRVKLWVKDLQNAINALTNVEKRRNASPLTKANIYAKLLVDG
jgi:hypothetical protein